MSKALLRLESALTQWKVALALAFALVVLGCNRSKEPAITGRAADPAVSLRPNWQLNQRYVYRVDATTAAQVPRRNSKNIIRAETTVGQDVAFTVTDAAPDGSRVVLMELIALQMDSGTEERVSASYDSENPSFTEETPLAERLQKLKGARLIFHLSPENTIKRVDGIKEFNARTSGSGSVRGVAQGVLSRFFSAPFFRDLVEMNMLPKNPVKVGEQWKVTRSANPGLIGTGSPLEMTYTFKGWQMHDGTNCARIDFEGVYKPNARTNQGVVRQIVSSVVPPDADVGSVTGRTWYEPGIGLAVETIIEQNVKSTSTSVRTPRAAGTNAVTNALLVDNSVTNAAPAPPPPSAPAATVTTTTTASQQHISIKLVEINTVEPASTP